MRMDASMTYAAASASCMEHNARLCTRDEICRGGAPVHQTAEHIMWVPVSDNKNEWLQIASSGIIGGMCELYTEYSYGSTPPWSDQEVAVGRGEFCCMPSTEESEAAIVREHAVSWMPMADTTTYSGAEELCRVNGQRLCTQAEICPGGPGEPRSEQSLWVPVADAGNEWLQVGPEWTCELHTEVEDGVYGNPPWGERPDAHRSRGELCCIADTSPATAEIAWMAVANTTTHSAASALCKDSSRRLCTREEICPDGETPARGHAEGSSWVPVWANDWLQIGAGDFSCQLHTEVLGGAFGPAPWSERAVANSARRVICCIAADIQPEQTHGIGADIQPEQIPTASPGHGAAHTELRTPPSTSLADQAQGSFGDQPSWISTTTTLDRKIWWDEAMPNTMTYSEARAHCQADPAGRLCTQEEVCPHGPKKQPANGYSGQNSFVPVSDTSNQWVQIGNQDTVCTAQHQPEWGEKPDAHSMRHSVCCSNHPLVDGDSQSTTPWSPPSVTGLNQEDQFFTPADSSFGDSTTITCCTAALWFLTF